MKVGLYFGSFNPVHIGHLIIGEYVYNNTDIEQVWFIVSPQNPLKKLGSLLNAYHRLHLLRLAVEDNSRFFVSDVEFKLPIPSYTIDTLTYIVEKYPQHNLTIIVGSDSYQNLENWKNYDQLINTYSFVVYERPAFPVKKVLNNNHLVLKAPQLEISATEVRNQIKEGKSVRYMLPEKVYKEIAQNGYYQ